MENFAQFLKYRTLFIFYFHKPGEGGILFEANYKALISNWTTALLTDVNQFTGSVLVNNTFHQKTWLFALLPPCIAHESIWNK